MHLNCIGLGPLGGWQALQSIFKNNYYPHHIFSTLTQKCLKYL